MFDKNLKSSFLHEWYIWLWGYWMLWPTDRAQHCCPILGIRFPVSQAGIFLFFFAFFCKVKISKHLKTIWSPVGCILEKVNIQEFWPLNFCHLMIASYLYTQYHNILSRHSFEGLSCCSTKNFLVSKVNVNADQFQK